MERLEYKKLLGSPPASLGYVISPRFCAPESDPVNLEIIKSIDGDYTVDDLNLKNNVFKADGNLFKVHDGFRLNDADGRPLVTLRNKIVTAHDRWQGFKGHSIDSKDLLFTALKSSMFQVKNKLEVFLANNTKERVFDFKVEETWSHDKCTIYAGDPSTIVAEMHKKTGKSGHFMVKVYPKMDYAFVTAIILILDIMNKSLKLPTGTLSLVSTLVGCASSCASQSQD